MATAVRTPRTKPLSIASGWALYQATKSVADQLPGRSSPGTPSRRSAAAPTQYTTASYSSRSLAGGSAGPISTPPRKRTRSSSRTARRLFCSDLIFSWSGATP